MTEPARLESDQPSAKKSESLDSSLVTLEDFKGASTERQAEERKVAVGELSADIDEGNKLSPQLKFLEQSRELGALFLKADLAGI
ncbi:MAG: hypothetical protein K2W82_08785 [Candidatus Obscuribacterales bacterium]|nr:hypothetical protein [Candidatus Obscuribacterales bacterium]